MSIFNYPGRHYGKTRKRTLDDQELHVAQTYVLRNCPEVQPYLEMFTGHYRAHEFQQNEIDGAIDEHFAVWFRTYVSYT